MWRSRKSKGDSPADQTRVYRRGSFEQENHRRRFADDDSGAGEDFVPRNARRAEEPEEPIYNSYEEYLKAHQWRRSDDEIDPAGADSRYSDIGFDRTDRADRADRAGRHASVDECAGADSRHGSTGESGIKEPSFGDGDFGMPEFRDGARSHGARHSAESGLLGLTDLLRDKYGEATDRIRALPGVLLRYLHIGSGYTGKHSDEKEREFVAFEDLDFWSRFDRKNRNSQSGRMTQTSWNAWEPEPRGNACDEWNAEPPGNAYDEWNQEPPGNAYDEWNQESRENAYDEWNAESPEDAYDGWVSEPRGNAYNEWNPEPWDDSWNHQSTESSRSAWESREPAHREPPRSGRKLRTQRTGRRLRPRQILMIALLIVIAWAALLGISMKNGAAFLDGNSAMVETARQELGNEGGEKFWSWYGFDSEVDWCACFVSWCADQNGYLSEGKVPKFSYVQTGLNWFKDKEKWRNAGEKPVAGDIIFFDWNDNDVADHVGIVAGYHLGRVFTIEGNASGDICKRKSYWVFSKYIMGYGTPESE